MDLQKITLTTAAAVFRSDNSIKTGGLASIDLSKYSNLEYGVCFGEEDNPTVNDNVSISGVSSGGDFESIIGKDKYNSEKTVFIRAYVKNKSNNSIKYGNQVKAEKGENPGTTLNVQSITLTTLEAQFRTDNSIRTGGECSVDLSNYENIQFGVCFGFDPNPTLNDNSLSSYTTTGKTYEAIIFESYIELNRPIYIRAYVSDSKGSVKYGNQVVAEKKVDLKITKIKNISTDEFTVDYTVGEGFGSIIETGYIFSTSPNPTSHEGPAKMNSGSGSGSFSLSSEGFNSRNGEKLIPGKTYYVKAYVATSRVIYYSEEHSFRLAGYTGGSGGIIFYDKGSLTDGWRYLEAANSKLMYNTTDKFRWDCGTNGNVVVNTGVGIGEGEINSDLMYDVCAYAINVGAVGYTTIVNNKQDWFLPSLEEWKLLGQAYEKGAVYMEAGVYWTSSQINTTSAHAISVSHTFNNAVAVNRNKNESYFGWPIRKF